MRVLERYFEAMRSHDWEALAECLAEDVHRVGPYCDEIHGRKAYVDYLAAVVPALASYELRVSRMRRLEGGSVAAELSETMDLGGSRTRFPELLLFDFDSEDRILRVEVYLQDPTGRPRRQEG